MLSTHTSCSHFPSPPTWWIEARRPGRTTAETHGLIPRQEGLSRPSMATYRQGDDPDRADLDSDALRRLRETEQTSKSRIEVMRMRPGHSLSGKLLGAVDRDLRSDGSYWGGPKKLGASKPRPRFLNSSPRDRSAMVRDWVANSDSVATFRAHNHPDADTRDQPVARIELPLRALRAEHEGLGHSSMRKS